MALIHVSKDPPEHKAISLGYALLSKTKVKTLFSLRPGEFPWVVKLSRNFTMTC